MGITLQQVTRALDGGGFKYIDLDGEALFLGIQGDNLEAKVILYLDEGGEYLDMRAVEFATLSPEHPDLDEVLHQLASINYQYRVAKFGWDPSTGEVKAEASIPLEDNDTLDQEQLTMFLGLFFSVCDEIWPALEEAIGPQEAPAPEEIVPPRPAEGAMRRRVPIWALVLGLAALAGVIYLVVR